MISSWMLYAGVIGCLVAGAATAVETVLRDRRLPTRGLWVLALLASVGLPAVSFVPRPEAASDRFVLAEVEVGGGVADVLTVDAPSSPLDGSPLSLDVSASPGPSPVPGPSVRLPELPASWSVWAVGGWAALSALGLLWLVLSGVGLSRRRREWRAVSLNGRDVLVAPDTGPAVVGLARPEIVLPEWTLSMEPADRELMIRHEEEHRRAGDLVLVTAAMGLLLAFPWSPALWWQLRRLRLAVEVDCDRRVLARGRDVSRYGALLLDLGLRGRGSGAAALLAFARPMPSLEKRIRLMTSRATFRPVRSAVLAALAALLAIGACRMEAPPPRSPAVPATTGPEAGPVARPVEMTREVGTIPPPPEPVVEALVMDAPSETPRLEPPVEPQVAAQESRRTREAQEAAATQEAAAAQEAQEAQRAREAMEMARLRQMIEQAREVAAMGQAMSAQAMRMQELARSLQSEVQLPDSAAVAELQESARRLQSSLEGVDFEGMQAQMRAATERLQISMEAMRSSLDAAGVAEARLGDAERQRMMRAAFERQRGDLERERVRLERAERALREMSGRDSAGLAEAYLRQREAAAAALEAVARARVALDSVDNEEARVRQSEAMEAYGEAVATLRQTYGRITGRILAPDGETPLGGVQVELSDQGIHRGQSGADGNFSLAAISPGSHRLTFTHPEYGRWERAVEVLPGGEVRLGDVIAPGG